MESYNTCFWVCFLSLNIKLVRCIWYSLCSYDLFFWLHYSAAAAAKSLQSCPTLCDPIDSSPPGSPVPGILQARVLEWGAAACSCIIVEDHKVLPVACFVPCGMLALHWLSWVVRTEITWLTKPKIFAIWPFSEKAGALQFMGLQRVGHNWASELNWVLLL